MRTTLTIIFSILLCLAQSAWSAGKTNAIPIQDVVPAETILFEKGFEYFEMFSVYGDVFRNSEDFAFALCDANKSLPCDQPLEKETSVTFPSISKLLHQRVLALQSENNQLRSKYDDIEELSALKLLAEKQRLLNNVEMQKLETDIVSGRRVSLRQ